MRNPSLQTVDITGHSLKTVKGLSAAGENLYKGYEGRGGKVCAVDNFFLFVHLDKKATRLSSIPRRPVAFRPCLTTGLALVKIR
jgi:hypothetical protein